MADSPLFFLIIQNSNDIICHPQKLGRAFPHQKFRDVLKLCTIRHSQYATFVLLGIEAQSDIHYAMPVRNYLYDALNYAAQVEASRKNHTENKDLRDSDEFLSGFAKDDKLLPVITLCVCFDKATWDAPRSLYEMVDIMDPRIEHYVNDYKLNLITPQEITDCKKFASELGIVFEFIQKSDDKERLRDIIESQEKYHHIDTTTVDLINTYTAANISTENAEGGKVDMCKAIQDLQNDARAEGHKAGQNEGRTKRDTELNNLIQRCRKSGATDSQILREIEQSINKNASRSRKKQS